jgi:hypothetical protein
MWPLGQNWTGALYQFVGFVLRRFGQFTNPAFDHAVRATGGWQHQIGI